MSKPSTPNRRTLLRGTTASAVAFGLAPSIHARTRRQENTDTLKIGLVGCGGRGSGAVYNALMADENTQLVALGDAFPEPIERCYGGLMARGELAPRVAVTPDTMFTGFDAYKQVIDACDVVLLATSPHFRPLHLEYAVAQGKHVFCEKPVAVDAPGARRVLDTCRKAEEQGLSVVSGLCYRYSFAKRETVERIHAGAIGDIAAIQTTYNTGGLWYREPGPEWSEMEVQMRNWLYYTWLSGDHITEQHIHSLDKAAWVMGSNPIKATSSGGRIVRTDPKWGNAYDHFSTAYEFEGGKKAFSSCRQWVGASSDVSDHIFGTQGTAELQSHSIRPTKGDRWKWRGTGDDSWMYRRRDTDDMYQNEHDALFYAIRRDEPINNGQYMCDSTMMAIMGRMAAYTGQTITWDQAWASTEDLSPAAYEWGDLETRPVALPGITKFI